MHGSRACRKAASLSMAWFARCFRKSFRRCEDANPRTARLSGIGKRQKRKSIVTGRTRKRTFSILDLTTSALAGQNLWGSGGEEAFLQDRCPASVVSKLTESNDAGNSKKKRAGLGVVDS